MIKLSKTRIMKSLHRAVTPGYNVDQEGLALVYVVSNGEGTVSLLLVLLVSISLVLHGPRLSFLPSCPM